MAAQSASSGLLSVSQLARQRQRDKALISRQVAALVAAGRLKTHSGRRGAKLVDPAEFDEALGETVDVVKLQAATTARQFRAADAAATPSPAQRGELTLSKAQIAKIAYEAQLRKIELAEKRGSIVPLIAVVDALREAGDAIVSLIDRLPLRAQDLTAAASKGGETHVRNALKKIAFDLRVGVADALRKIESAGKAEEAAGPLTADLDRG